MSGVPGAAALRVADVSCLYAERSGGIRTYLEAKGAWARRTAAVDQHLVIPGERRRSGERRHELRSVRYAPSNGYRVPLGGGGMRATIGAIEPDVILLHDPFWTPARTAREAHAADRLVVAVHHTSVDLNANAFPGTPGLWRRPLRRWYRHAYREVDAVMSVVDPFADSGRHAGLALRFGLHPAFRPRPALHPGRHVLFAGRFSREKGVAELLEATALGEWELVMHGTGPWEATMRDRIRSLGIEDRVRIEPFVADREQLAQAFARAACVAVPGPYETFGLVALEAAASAAPVVVADTAPSGAMLGALGHSFAAGDAADLARAIEEARHAPRLHHEAAVLTRRHGWDAAFEAELGDLQALLGDRRGRHQPDRA